MKLLIIIIIFVVQPSVDIVTVSSLTLSKLCLRSIFHGITVISSVSRTKFVEVITN